MKIIASESLIWLALIVIFTLAMFLTVPVPNISRLMLFGVIAGFGLAVVVMSLMDPLLHLARYNYANVPGLPGIPLLAAAAWLPVEIIFANYFSKMETKTQVYLYILTFAVGATILDYLSVLLGIREFISWNLLATFLLSLAIHIGLAYYLTVSNYAREKIS